MAAPIGVTVQTFTRTTLTLDCIAEGSPQPVVSWTKNGDPLESEGGRVSVKDDGTVIIKNTRVSDSGTYICEAESVVGETSVASAVYVRGNLQVETFHRELKTLSSATEHSVELRSKFAKGKKEGFRISFMANGKRRDKVILSQISKKVAYFCLFSFHLAT